MGATTLQLDAGNLPRLIGLGYEAGFCPATWRIFAEELAAGSGSRVAIISYLDHVDHHRSFIVSGGIGDEFNDLLSIDPDRGDDNCYCTALRASSPGAVYASDEITTREARHLCIEYSTMCAPWSLEHFLSGCITAGNGVSAYLTLGRTGHEPLFAEADKTLVRTLLPHLQRCLSLHREVAAVHEGRVLVAAVLDTAPDGVVIFDHQGSVAAFNHRAAEVFAEDDGLSVCNGRLHTTDGEAQAQLDAALSGALSPAGAGLSPPSTILVNRFSKHQPYKVVISPLPLPNNIDDLPAGRAAMAMIHHRWQDNDKTLATILRDTYGLTHAEIRMCHALFGGRSLSEAAVHLAISRNTAKTHLGHVFDKTGIRSQASLVRFLAFGARRL